MPEFKYEKPADIQAELTRVEALLSEANLNPDKKAELNFQFALLKLWTNEDKSFASDIKNEEAIRKNPEYARDLQGYLALLHQYTFLDDDTRSLLSEKANFVAQIFMGITSLKRADFYNNETRALICENANNADKVARAIIILRDQNLYNKENLTMVQRNPEHSVEIAFCLIQIELPTKDDPPPPDIKEKIRKYIELFPNDFDRVTN